MGKKHDFGGWATKNDIKCSDGRTIRKDAFKHNDGKTVPLVWNHLHNEPYNILGHALLENREEGVYAYCTFNSTAYGQNAKELVRHGDVTALSIYANKLKEIGKDVVHGAIREVSLVLAGANPGAFIDWVLEHGEGEDLEVIIGTGEVLDLQHSDDKPDEEDPKKTGEQKEDKESPEDPKEIKHSEESSDDETLQDVFDTLTDKQKNVVYAMIGQIAENEMEQSEGEDETTMKHNVFDSDGNKQEKTLTHSETREIFSDIKKYGSLRESVVQHGIDDIEFLFPEAKLLNVPPDIIGREMGWVKRVMGGVHKTPFSRIKSMFADLREDDARAKGYIKGNQKVEEVFGLLKRTTTPQTIYKLQKLDRDDILDITDFDVVAWLKSEMRMMLDEEIARAILVGDGRPNSSNDKINPINIRPIWTDDDLFTIKTVIPIDASDTEDEIAKKFIRSAIKSRIEYKGSGSPVLFTTEEMLTDLLLMDDGIGRRLYESETTLATALRVREIITVPVMDGLTRTAADSSVRKLRGIIVNLNDYNVGADKGGAVKMFEDFDIDFNKEAYLIETRCSGAMIKPYSAIALETIES